MLSVVMPAYNEQALLAASVRDIVNGIRGWGIEFEVLVVENGSTDDTRSIASSLERGLPEVRVQHLRQANYGDALRSGLLGANGDVVVTFDVDYYDLHFLKQALGLLESSEDGETITIVVASKRAVGARDERAPLRRLATAVFDGILRMIFRIRASDTHGMKVLRRRPLLDHGWRFGEHSGSKLAGAGRLLPVVAGAGIAAASADGRACHRRLLLGRISG